MKTLVCVSSMQSVGCTFLDWSIHFLSGQDQHYNVHQSQWAKLTHNPLTTSTAHGHNKNHPHGCAATIQCVDQLTTMPGQLGSFYPAYPDGADTYRLLNVNLDNTTQQDWQRLQDYNYQDYNQLINYCADHNVKIVFVDLDCSVILYTHASRNPSGEFYDSYASHNSTNKDQFNFFNSSIQTWTKLGLNNVWDQREHLALNIRPFDVGFVNIAHSFDFEHLWLDSRELWHNGQHAMQKVLDYLEIPMDHDRLLTWMPIYHNWQKIQLRMLDFVYRHKHIVDAIVNNNYYSIGSLTFDQEAIIQHCLIYQHGLNLKTWQLSKFPDNTRDLHKLLEPNIHQIASIY